MGGRPSQLSAADQFGPAISATTVRMLSTQGTFPLDWRPLMNRNILTWMHS